ncbi:hypothetical protein SAMN04487914_11341 [Arthrobacter sp. ok909]|uniref:hypothetical protein n=1 Tax=Arthrobacter sp. ok909 TaxID=1761746 RepID=UPI0008860D9F|nr:hypothetical protein [Arthrobacter sp. ok909]SDP49003.1 hypothetical protein SAMN04487914_11341 [Arthrobacter sp. ok909]
MEERYGHFRLENLTRDVARSRALARCREKVTPVRHKGTGEGIGFAEKTPMVLLSGGIITDIRELLANVTDEDQAQLGDFRVERERNANSGRIVLDRSLKGEISLGMKHLGGL